MVGAGQTLTDRHKDRREEERERRKETIARVKEDRQFKRQSGLLANTQPDAAGNVQGVTRGGDVIDLGFKAQPKANAAQSGMSAGDKRILDAATAIYTAKDSDTGIEKTDWSKVATHLRKRGHAALAQLVDPGKDASTTIDVSSDQYLEAQRMAEEWTSDQAGFFSTDESDFADHGGNKAQALQAKTMEFYQQLTGTKPAASETKRPSGGTGIIAIDRSGGGSGTQASPHTPKTQDEYDQIPSGSYYVDPESGKTFKKS